MFGKSVAQWEQVSGIFTAAETAQQPATWRKTMAQMKALRDSLQSYIGQVTEQADYEIILTGAGTSEFVGNAALAAVSARYGSRVRSLGTTDIVAAPEKYLSAVKPTLLISFARSGNSPESVGTVDAADAICGNLRHLFITCNEDGALAKAARSRDNCFSIVLTPETNDRSFAMTSSFSNMYLAVLCALQPDALEQIADDLERVCAAGEACIGGYELFEKIVNEYDYDRLVYLGTAELKGIAQESALKTLELTAGQVAAVYDSPMGFRHGPKSIVNDHTLTVIYLSDDPYTRRYEMDLVREMSRQRSGNRLLAVTNGDAGELAELCDYCYAFELGKALPSSLLGLDFVLTAQILALLKSQALGITTDNPCPTGEVNRVVKGVTIYPCRK